MLEESVAVVQSTPFSTKSDEARARGRAVGMAAGGLAGMVAMHRSIPSIERGRRRYRVIWERGRERVRETYGGEREEGEEGHKGNLPLILGASFNVEMLYHLLGPNHRIQLV